MAIGMHIPNYTVEKYLNFMVMNSDKNYLTPLEIAALADNHILEITVESVVTLLQNAGIYTDNEASRAAIIEAVKLARYARGL